MIASFNCIKSLTFIMLFLFIFSPIFAIISEAFSALQALLQSPEQVLVQEVHPLHPEQPPEQEPLQPEQLLEQLPPHPEHPEQPLEQVPLQPEQLEQEVHEVQPSLHV